MKLFSSFLLVGALLAPRVALADEPEPLPAPDAQSADAPTLPTPAAAPAPAPASPAAPAPSAAASPPPPAWSAEASQPAPEGPPRHDLLRVALGFRIGYLPEKTFDTFADSDVLPQFSLEATYGFLSSGKFALAAGVAWDVGARGDDARGQSTHIAMNRLTVPIEARYHALNWLYAFARVAPGALSYQVEVQDASSSAPLKHAPWAFATDLSAGASLLLGPHRDLDKRSPHVWITPEIGYALATSRDLSPKPDRDDADVLGSDGRVNLGSLAANGFFWRATLAMTF